MINVTKIRQLIEKEDEGPTLDYKEDLTLEADCDKAQFIKDVISLANSGQTAHIVTGVEDGTHKLVGIKTSHRAEQLNDILKGKCDPSLSVEYTERTILGHRVGVVEVTGENRPYVVGVHDRYGGHLSANPKKECYIYRGMVFIRNFNKNEGACRADLDKMYQLKYVTLQADLQLSHEVSTKELEGSREADIIFFLENSGEVIATDTYVWMQFKNVKEIARCKGNWKNRSSVNANIPTVSLVLAWPVVRPIQSNCAGVVVNVDSDVTQIEASVIMGATNMRTKQGSYVIALEQEE